MRLSLKSAALPLAFAALVAAQPAAKAHQSVYADAYGNLIVHNPSGYKQIIVGKGHLADELRAEIGEPEVIYVEPRRKYRRSTHRGNDRRHRADNVTCIPYGMVLKGRSYMYGSNKGEAAYLDKYCR